MKSEKVVGYLTYIGGVIHYSGFMRSIWSGALTFGLVNIPVKLYSATSSQDFDLHMLHKKDLAPIRYARVCKLEEKEVPFQDVAKGYEIEKDDFIVLTDEDIKKANVKKSKSIEIQYFTDEKEIDPLYYEKPYYLEPEKNAGKSYDLLLEALKESGKVGIAKFVLRTRENIAIIRPYKNALIIDQLRYASELRSLDELHLPEEKTVSDKELEMAKKFITQLSEKFRPEKLHDTYHEELERIIEEKAKDKPVTVHGKEPVPTKVNDLMSALKASLEQHQDNK